MSLWITLWKVGISQHSDTWKSFTCQLLRKHTLQEELQKLKKRMIFYVNIVLLECI